MGNITFKCFEVFFVICNALFYSDIYDYYLNSAKTSDWFRLQFYDYFWHCAQYYTSETMLMLTLCQQKDVFYAIVKWNQRAKGCPWIRISWWIGRIWTHSSISTIHESIIFATIIIFSSSYFIHIAYKTSLYSDKKGFKNLIAQYIFRSVNHFWLRFYIFPLFLLFLPLFLFQVVRMPNKKETINRIITFSYWLARKSLSSEKSV